MRLMGRGAFRRLALVIFGMAVAAQLALAGSVGAGGPHSIQVGATSAADDVGASTGVSDVVDGVMTAN